MARGKKKTVIDTAHPHTIKKFELIEEYIKSWSQKLMLYENCNMLVFIDCMKNGWNRAWFPIRWNCWIERSQGSVIKFSLYNFASQRTLL